jgi:hypothetical protein
MINGGFRLANEANGGLLGSTFFAGRNYSNKEYLLFVFQFALGCNCSTIGNIDILYDNWS